MVIKVADEIIIINNGEISTMPSRSFREGLLGKTLESGLQTLIEQHPQIIPGGQIAPGGDDPPRFALLCREMAVGSWSLDFLLIDQYGVPTLVEAKLAENPDSRRAVVGQIIEYATNASEYWSGGRLREKAIDYWRDKGKDIEEIMSKLLSDDKPDTEAFWKLVDKNLTENRIRLIIATDELRPEVRKIIEFLNRETKTIEILGLEIKCFGSESKHVALVPSIIGQSQVVAEQKSTASQKRLWDYDELQEFYEGMDNKLRAKRLKKVLDWAKSLDVLMVDKKLGQSFSIKNKWGKRLMTFWQRGQVYTFIHLKYYDGKIEERDNLVSELNKFHIFDYKPETIIDGQTSPGTLEDLSENEFEEFLKLLEKYCCGESYS